LIFTLPVDNFIKIRAKLIKIKLQKNTFGFRELAILNNSHSVIEMRGDPEHDKMLNTVKINETQTPSVTLQILWWNSVWKRQKVPVITLTSPFG
jgi:hypothetical protein